RTRPRRASGSAPGATRGRAPRRAPPRRRGSRHARRSRPVRPRRTRSRREARVAAVQGDLAHQLEMNRVTWAELQRNGVTDATELRLDFVFVAPGAHQAEALAQAIRSRTDYEVEAVSSKQGLLGKQVWTVNGTTQPTAVSLEMLDEWVTRMVEWGNAHTCEFD